MVRSLLAGGTSYENQPRSELFKDLREMIEYAQEMIAWIEQKMREANERNHKVPSDILSYVGECHRLAQTIIEFEDVVRAIETDSVRESHVKRVARAGEQAIRLNREIGRCWNNDLVLWRAQNDWLFAEGLYAKCRDFFASHMDLSNMAVRLPDFVTSARSERPSMATIQITGDGNVIGSNNQVVTHIHKGLMGNELRAVGEAFAFLKADIFQSTQIPEKIRKRVVRVIEDAEEEMADPKRDQSTIEDDLKRAKGMLEDAGETYDAAAGWGKRLAELARVLLRVLPGVWPWLRTLLD